ncbi:MAG: toxin-antitoxin system HicB family antitoxin [Bacteroidales bacterium]|nr:toxin-antitoxin system HicB family antitoxin [Bacteroidales bacterium]
METAVETATSTKVQTVIRIPEELYVKAKYKAKQQNISFNSYMEQVLANALRPAIPKLPKDFKISPVVELFSGMLTPPTEEQLAADDKLAYIWNKGRR